MSYKRNRKFQTWEFRFQYRQSSLSCCCVVDIYTRESTRYWLCGVNWWAERTIWDCIWKTCSWRVGMDMKLRLANRSHREYKTWSWSRHQVVITSLIFETEKSTKWVWKGWVSSIRRSRQWQGNLHYKENNDLILEEQFESNHNMNIGRECLDRHRLYYH